MGFNIFALVLLKIHEKLKFATIITIMYYYVLCILLKANYCGMSNNCRTFLVSVTSQDVWTTNKARSLVG